MTGAAAQVMDDDTTDNSGDDPAEVAAQAADAAALQGPPSKEGLQNAKDVVAQYKASTSEDNPQYQSLMTQYGINAQQARQILQNARDTLANTPLTPPGFAEQAYASGLAESANKKNWGGPGIDAANAGASYTTALGQQLAALQARNQGLTNIDLSMNQAGQGALDAKLKMLLANQQGWAKALPAATRVLGGEDKGTNPVPMDAVSKLYADHKAGLIPDNVFQNRLAKLSETSAQAAANNPDAIAGMSDRADLMRHYKIPAPAGFGANSPTMGPLWKMITDRNKAEGLPEYDATQFPARQRALNYFSNGQGAGQLQSLDAMVNHVSLLEQAATELHNNGNSPMYNWIANQIATATGAPAPKGFENIRDIAANEVSKFIVAGPTAEADRSKLQKNISESSSNEQFFGDDGIFSALHHLVGGQVGALRQRYKSTTKLGDNDFNGYLEPETLATLNQWNPKTPPGGTTPPGTAAAPTSAAPAPLVGKGQTVTQADVAAYAQKHGLTPEIAKAHVLANGYTIK